MKRGRAPLVAVIAVASLAAAIAGAAAEDAAPPPLAPFQMVRSLQIVQDRLADGDQAALPMQKKLIEMIDARFRAATAEEFADRRNFGALLVYAMSGGNPATVETVADRLALDEHDSAVTEGLVAYFRGDIGRAAALLAPIDPALEQADVAAFLALVVGTVRARQAPAEGLAYLDLARLYAPGTLVEESALRRSIVLATTVDDPDRLLRASEQYVRRFLHSPYASNFADGFISGIVQFYDRLDWGEVERVVAAMNEEQQLAVYLRVARKSAILGHTALAARASANAVALGGDRGRGEDARADFYNALASVTSGPTQEIAARLEGIDRRTLSARDLRLLEAATAVVKEVLAPPIGTVAPASADAAGPSEPQAASGAAPDARPAPAPAALVSSAAPVPSGPPAPSPAPPPAVSAAAVKPASAQPPAAPLPASGPASAPASGPAAQTPASPAVATEDYVSATRKTLADIDRLLEKAP